MSPRLNALQVKTIKAELLEILEHLREDVGHEIKDQQGEGSNGGVADTHDRGEEATSDLESTINLANVSRHLNEIKECQGALSRLANGSYGLCICCNEEIELNRLKANPVTPRCLSCQSKEESCHPEVQHASL